MPQDFHDKITHWSSTGDDGYGGYSFALPTTLDARWEDKIEVFMSDDGRELRSRAIVYVSSDVKSEDYLMFGETTEANPVNLTDSKIAYPVQAFRKIPDLRNLDYERKVFL